MKFVFSEGTDVMSTMYDRFGVSKTDFDQMHSYAVACLKGNVEEVKSDTQGGIDLALIANYMIQDVQDWETNKILLAGYILGALTGKK